MKQSTPCKKLDTEEEANLWEFMACLNTVPMEWEEIDTQEERDTRFRASHQIACLVHIQNLQLITISTFATKGVIILTLAKGVNIPALSCQHQGFDPIQVLNETLPDSSELKINQVLTC